MMRNQLTFDPVQHIYKLNGIVLPSVTQIMNPLSREEYKTVDDLILERAAARGTKVHEAIEFYELYGMEDCPSEVRGYFDAYLAWRKDYKPEVLSSEQATWHTGLLYAGTADLIVKLNGRTYLIDLKTTSVINDMLTTVQLEAYARSLACHGVSLDGKAILQLKKDGTYQFKEYQNPDIEAWDTFTSLIKVRAHINKYKEA